MPKIRRWVALLVLFVTISGGGFTPTDEPVSASQRAEPRRITLLHTNDLHGHLEPDAAGRGGSARLATLIERVRSERGRESVLLVDAGDVFLAAPPISQLLEGRSAVDIYNLLGYDAVALGNHEFDKGERLLISRIQESSFPWVSANIVLSGSDWLHPAWVRPYVTATLGTSDQQVTLGIIGLTTDETPAISFVPTNLEFKDMTEAALRYYDEVKAQADGLLLLAHAGLEDVGQYKGLKRVARELAAAGKPVDLIVAGHDHWPLWDPVVVSGTAIIEAGFDGRWLGRADLLVFPEEKRLMVEDYTLAYLSAAITPTLEVAERVAYWSAQVAPLQRRPVGSTYISLTRARDAESLLGDLVTDGMRWKADQLDDGALNGSIQVAFTNPGGLRADILVGDTLPYTITWGHTFEVMPFGNWLVAMDLSGAQLQALLDRSATLYKGILQSSGITWSWYNDTGNDRPHEWGAYLIKVHGEPIRAELLYRVVTNSYLADGRDGWTIFVEGINRVDYRYMDMQEAVNEYIGAISPIEMEDIPTGRITRMRTLHKVRLPMLVKAR